MKSTYIPGPFRVGSETIKVTNPRSAFIPIYSDSGMVALVVSGNGRANVTARLLARAPDLLRDCEDFAAIVRELSAALARAPDLMRERNDLVAIVREVAARECVCDLPPEGESDTLECFGCRASAVLAKAVQE